MSRPKIPRPIGHWTVLKLDHLSAYLSAFAVATKRSQQRYYIDAMAGCGDCVMARSGHPIEGSAWRALKVEPAFTAIHLVEMDPASARHLTGRMSSYSNVRVYLGDCNEVIPQHVLPSLPRVAPTLAFIDPTGVQPTWSLIESLARHRRGVRGEKIELLILFAFDMFINRWLSRPALSHRLTDFYGDERWKSEWYESVELQEAIDARRARFTRLYVDRLTNDLGYRFCESYGPLKRGRHSLYQMIFATDHAAGYQIMGDVWKKFRPPPDDMFYQTTFTI